MRSASTAPCACSACWVRRWRSSAVAAWAANALSTRRSSGRGAGPLAARVTVSLTGTWRSASPGVDGGACPTEAATCQPVSSSWPVGRSSRLTVVSPNVSRNCSSRAASGSAPCRTLPARVASVAASAAARAASRVRRAARSTTALTAAATTRKASSASRLFRSAMVKVPTGGVKYQFSSRLAATAAARAG